MHAFCCFADRGKKGPPIFKSEWQEQLEWVRAFITLPSDLFRLHELAENVDATWPGCHVKRQTRLREHCNEAK